MLQRKVTALTAQIAAKEGAQKISFQDETPGINGYGFTVYVHVHEPLPCLA
jgi:hypothetical protein